MKSLFDSNEQVIEQAFVAINQFADKGKLKKALTQCVALSKQYPDHPRVLQALGMLRYRSGEGCQVAEPLLRRAIALKPDFADAYYNLGLIQQYAVLNANAEESFRCALKYTPDNYKAMIALAVVLIAQEQISEANELCKQVLKINSHYAPLYQTLASLMLICGRADEAENYLKTSLKIQNTDAAASCLLFTMNLLPHCTQIEIYNQSKKWGQIVRQCDARRIRDYLNSKLSNRKIRIGYISGDFKLHPITPHLKPVLAYHDKSNTEIYLYNSYPHADQLTEIIADYAYIYRDISDLSDLKTENIIRKDGIDILVDLSGHTAFHRLGLFALKPAPVQVTWLGYFNTTGLSAIDYLISDPITIPPSEDQYFSEQVVRLPNCRFCYQSVTNVPDVAVTPALQNGYLTFGSFNAIQKITAEVIVLWSRLLLALPDSKIILKSKSFSEKTVKEDFLRMFAEKGITAERIDLRPRSAYMDMLTEYGDVDIALDTFPYNGGATTCEALWMGVPVVTLEGGTPISRQSKAFLYTIGYPEWVASTPDEYIEIIKSLVFNLNSLQLFRSGLRQKMADSPLCDGKIFTGHLETAYRQMWQQWCATATPIKSFRQFSTDELCAAGYNYLNDGDVSEAIAIFNRALRRVPGHCEALNGLGKAFEKTGDYVAAAKLYKRAIRRDASNFYSYFNLGFLLLNSANFRQSHKVFLQALHLNPNHIETLVNLGVSSRMLGHLNEAQIFCKKALAIDSNHVGALSRLAFVLGNLGDVQQAIDLLKQAKELEPDNIEVLSALINNVFYDAHTKQEDVCALSKWIGTVISQITRSGPCIQSAPVACDHLRVGFVSPDFCRHPVGLLLQAFFKEFNPERISLVCYSNRFKPDPLTEWYQNRATAWRDISKLPDEDVVKLINEDNINILVDLSGHTSRHRLPVFNYLPAPVQATWLGFGHTTGLKSIDYIIADDDFIRPQDEQWFSEQVVRLPFNRFCFTPPTPCPEIVEPPLYDTEYVTFGSFNNPMKISEQVVAAWAQILLRVPRSRLVLKYKSFGDSSVRKRYQDLFNKHGVARRRIEFRKSSNPFFMMMEYGDIDIALDPFPFTGGMTSLYSLWMGVPIVTLSGELPISRQTASFLKLVGLPDLVAYNEEEYITNAVNLASDYEKLSDIRSELRDKMLSSPLCDAKRHAADLEKLFFEMWQRKVDSTQKTGAMV